MAPLFLTSTLDGCGCQLHDPVTLTVGEVRSATILRQVGWDPFPVFKMSDREITQPAAQRCPY
jgi:hypothetical protein